MNSIAKWFLESVAATVVIVTCFTVLEALIPPPWGLAISCFSILLYLSWRLDRQGFAWRRVALFAAIVGAVFVIQQELLPATWRNWSFYFVPIVALTLGPVLLRPKRNDIKPAAKT